MLRPDARTRVSTRPLLLVLPVGLILFALVLLPFLVGRRLSALHADITQVSDPLRGAVRDVQFYLALETAGTRAYLLTGDPAYAAKHLQARAERKRHLARVVELSGRSEGGIRDLGARLPALFDPADARLDSLFGGMLTRAEFVTRLSGQQERLESITGIVSAIGNSVSQSTAVNFERLKAVQRTATIIGGLLVALAVLAAVLVWRLALAHQALAERAQAAHRESEAARAEAESRRIEAERLAESRAMLVRGFSHDVRTPLNAASGYLQLMDSGLIGADDGQRRAKQAVDLAVTLINDLLELAHTESGKIAIRPQPLDLSVALEQLAEEWRPAIESRGLTLTVAIDDDVPFACTDRGRVQQVLTNFLSNAAKYTHVGGVVLRLSAERQDGTSPWLRIDVSDTGPGLNADDRAQLFREFHRLRSAEGTTGSGLGLAISLRIAQALGGRIEVQSEPGLGSTFTLLLPCDEPAPTPAAV